MKNRMGGIDMGWTYRLPLPREFVSRTVLITILGQPKHELTLV
jgi:hypothetical protein